MHILVTRPAHQAVGLAERIGAAGGNPVLFPVLEIQDVADPAPLLELIGRLDEFDLAVFVSPNAAFKAMDAICAKRALPATLAIAAVGQGTARALGTFGLHGVIAPTMRFDSEALLGMPELRQMEGKRIVIFRGDGGRDLLAKSLVKRGAVVEYAECYRRARPDADAGPLLQLLERREMDAVTITSSEGLRNLCEMVGDAGRAWLEEIPLFTSHERIAEIAGKSGFDRVILTAAGDTGLMEGLLNYFRPQAGAIMHPDYER